MGVIEVRRVINLQDSLDDIKALHRAHWHETEHYRDSELAFQYDLLIQYWNADILQIWGVFDGPRLVGHLSMYVTRSVHTGETIATEDALYVLPKYRGGYGAALARMMLHDLKERGVAEVWATCKPETRVGVLLGRLGFKHVADTYLIRLKDRSIEACARPSVA